MDRPPRPAPALIDVHHLALRSVMLHTGAAHDILTTLGVSESAPADDLLAVQRRVG